MNHSWDNLFPTFLNQNETEVERLSPLGKKFAKIETVRRHSHQPHFQTFSTLSVAVILIFPMVLAIGPCAFAGSVNDHPEVQRIRGFEEHLKEKREEEKDRERGLQLHLERLEIEKRQYEKALQEYRKQKKNEKPLEETHYYREYQADVKERHRKSEEALEDFRIDQKEERRMLKQANLNPLRELGLPEERPRFDLKKRTMYGATSPFGKGNTSGGPVGRGGAAPAPSFTPPENTFTPPGFDDFPPPPMDENFDLPPPPPLPPMEGELSVPQDDFFPPPPPPPPPMEDYQF